MSRKIRVITDDTSDLPLYMYEKLNLPKVLLSVNLGDANYTTAEMSAQQVFDYVSQTNQLPRTTAILPESLKEIVEGLLVDDDVDVLFVSLSSAISGGYNLARLLSEDYAPGRLVSFDSQHLSGGLGLVAMEAVRLAQEGLPMEQIVERLEAYRETVHTSFFVENVRYLYYGGRCSALQLLGANLLKIRPMIVMNDGALSPGDKLRGSEIRCMEQYLEKQIPDWSQIGPIVMINYTGDCSTMIEYVQGIIAKERPDIEVHVQHAGCNISCHCGPGTIGVLFTR